MGLSVLGLGCLPVQFGVRSHVKTQPRQEAPCDPRSRIAAIDSN